VGTVADRAHRFHREVDRLARRLCMGEVDKSTRYAGVIKVATPHTTSPTATKKKPEDSREPAPH